MAYAPSRSIAGPRGITRPVVRAPSDDDDGDGFPSRRRPAGAPIDWGRLAVFGLGVALGAVLGSGTTLLVAPQSGKEVRARLRRRGRRLRTEASDAWDDLQEELRWRARQLKTRARRKLVRAGWAAADRARSRRRIAC